jgi:hypothetical protein
MEYISSYRYVHIYISIYPCLYIPIHLSLSVYIYISINQSRYGDGYRDVYIIMNHVNIPSPPEPILARLRTSTSLRSVERVGSLPLALLKSLMGSWLVPLPPASGEQLRSSPSLWSVESLNVPRSSISLLNSRSSEKSLCFFIQSIGSAYDGTKFLVDVVPLRFP